MSALILVANLSDGDFLPDSVFPYSVTGQAWPTAPATKVTGLSYKIDDGGQSNAMSIGSLPAFSLTLTLGQAGAAGVAHKLIITAQDDTLQQTSKTVTYIRPPQPTTTTSTTTSTTTTTTTTTTRPPAPATIITRP
jgi:hypothetical protein